MAISNVTKVMLKLVRRTDSISHIRGHVTAAQSDECYKGSQDDDKRS